MSKNFKNTCPECGSNKVFPGRHFNLVSGIGSQYFRPRGLKLLTAHPADVPITDKTFIACAESGLLWTRIDPEMLQQVVRESGNKAARKSCGAMPEAYPAASDVSPRRALEVRRHSAVGAASL